MLRPGVAAEHRTAASPGGATLEPPTELHEPASAPPEIAPEVPDVPDVQEVASIAWIPAPRTIEDVGVARTLLEDLALKTIAREREMTTRGLAERLGLGAAVVDEIFQRLRKAQLVEVTGLTGTVYRATLTLAGRTRAEEALAASQYVGPAPVSLDAYTAQVRAQSVAGADVRPDDVRRAFGSLVLGDDVVRQIGIAIASGTSLVLSGPSGTGKTAVAACIPEVFGGGVFIPYAVEVAGQIIAVFDPGMHRPIDAARPPDHDRRWVYCERPFVIAGGELTAEMLDLQHNAASGFYAAPLQMKANTGVFVIDDFGRQRMSAEELLNRWIVPLDRGLDFLTLHGGNKFAVPFAVLVVFSTNLDPASGFAADGSTGVSDAAFLRRIPNKVALHHATPEQFHEIFRRVCTDFGLVYDEALVDRLVAVMTTELREPLRPCVPRDLTRQITWEARYDGLEPELTGATLARACRAYFGSVPSAGAGAGGLAGG